MGTIREREDSMAGNTSQPSIKRVWGIAKSPELKLTDEDVETLVFNRDKTPARPVSFE